MTRAIYIRTSTNEQDGAAQHHALNRAAAAKGWLDDPANPADYYCDLAESGAKARRPHLDALRAAIARGEVSDVLTFALDRIGRSLVDVVLLVDEWAARGVTLETLREGRLDPATPFGRFVLQIFAALAEMERAIIRERVKAGMDRARAKGTRSGKPVGRQRVRVDVQRARALRAQGRSWRSISKALGVKLRTLTRAVAQTPPEILPRAQGGRGVRP